MNSAFTSQAFAGVTGASFSRINGFNFGASVSMRWKRWENGLSYGFTLPATISPFTLSDNTAATASLKFQTFEFFTGIVYMPVRVQFIYGFEMAGLSGTPALGYTGGLSKRLGGAIWWDFYRIFPVGFMLGEKIITHGARDYVLANYPSDTVSVSSGLELDTILRIYYEF